MDPRSVQLDSDTRIAPNATIMGDVEIGSGSSIWFGAVIRTESEPIRIGSDTNIQDNVTLHVNEGSPCTVGNRVIIGHNAVVHACTVEDDVVIGMGSTIMDDAVIGAGSIVAAGALVSKGTVLPPRSVAMGVPAKVRSTIDAEAAAKNAGDAEMYVRESDELVRRGIMYSGASVPTDHPTILVK